MIGINKVGPLVTGNLRQVRTAAALVGGIAVLGLVAVAVVGDPGLVREVAKPLQMLHGLLSSAVVAGLAIVALTVVVVPVSQVLAGIGAMQKLLTGAAMAVSLPFADTADPGEGKAGAAPVDDRAAARSEFQLGGYGGWNGTSPADVRFRQPNGTDLTIKDVKWIGDSFKEEPYWGLRATYWPARLRSTFGVMFDYSHAKATAIKTQQLTLSGTRDGKPVDGKEPFSKTFRKLEFTHGLNFFTLNGVYRLAGLQAKVAPYVGVGVGISMPHVDTRRAGWDKETRTYVHQITGPTVQVLGGLEWRVLRTERASAFTEYKLNYSANVGRLKGGGTLETDLWTHQTPVGFSYHYRRAPR